MLLKGSITSDKSKILAENYARLLNSGVESSKILVLVQNANKKSQFIEMAMENLGVDSLEKLQVYSFWGLVYNTISDCWPIIENMIKSEDNISILPNLVGLEVSQYILREIIKDVKFEGYNSKKSLLHQLFRRYSLIVQNKLDDAGIKWRSEEVLKESFAPDAKKALDELKHKTLNLRGLDYLRQGLIFNYIYEKTNYFSGIEYLIIDDGDEITPICFEFVKFLAPQLKEVFIAYDELGSSRSGYLSADKKAAYEFENIFPGEKIIELQPKSGMREDTKTIFENIIEQKLTKLKRFTLNSFSKRALMLDAACEDIKAMVNSGVKPCDIVLITPVVDDMLEFCIKENLKSSFVRPVFLSGSEKLIENPLVLASINILKMCDRNLKTSIGEFELRAIMTGVLGIPTKHCKEILENFEKTGELIKFSFTNKDYEQKYSKFQALFKSLQEKDLKLSQQVYQIYKELVDFSVIKPEFVNKLNFFIERLENFESVFKNSLDKAEIIVQLENSIISENPYSTFEIEPDDLVIATPQKIIDNQIESKFQFWLDVSSDEWIKSDTGPLYNAWVFQAGWDKEEYTLNDNLELGLQKTARILRKLTLCADSKIIGYASLFDGSGIENFGGIERYLKFEPEQKIQTPARPIVPREDQKPVLAYKSGKMAISAVPGAGKTTILLALILKILDNGVNPENIFVLTYMESAARNFRERIQNMRKEISQLPNISTIHGLALKILKENANYERLNLTSDFEICDDTQRSRILHEISAKLGIKPKESEDFDRAVSVLKMGTQGGKENFAPAVTDKKLTKFLQYFEEYKSVLKENNLIDYDDMLLFSVELLEKNPDILEYYQEICQFIIEDEAQDSSAIQQKLITLLSAKHKNLIRCGDINQAITTTFSNADVKGFRNFIESAETKVSMDCSQRCCRDVWQLANNTLNFAKKTPHAQNAFYEIFMRPVEGKNPEEKNAISSIIFENDFAEKNFILKQIKTFLTKNPKATCGILLRNNFQVGRWTKFINDSGLKCITRSECLEQKGVFRTIFAVLKLVQFPFDNEQVAQNYDVLAELGHYKSGYFAEIKNLAQPFIQSNPDEIKNRDLADFYWDFDYWLNFASLSPEELAIKIGLYYYSSEVEKSNVYLISTLIKRLALVNKRLPDLMDRLAELSKKPSLSGFKFFSEEDESDREFLAGKVQIMTMHKSKGDEFDYVFLPEFSEKSLTLDFEAVALKGNTKFMEEVRELNPNYKKKTDDELKEFILEENLRLFYVAITRAKRKLFLSVGKSAKAFGKMIPQEPSIVFRTLLNTKEAADE